MTTARRAVGRRGEEIAARHLEAQGLVVRATNWRCARGELDIVAADGPWLVLVEVRTRRGQRFGTPEESIGRTKRRKLAAVAECYVQESRWPGPWRIDVVAVALAPDGSVVRVTHYPGAIGG